VTDIPIQVHPIGVVQSGRREPIDDGWAGVEARIIVDSRFPRNSTAGVEEFSHLDVVYLFHLVDVDGIHSGARHPRGRTDWPKVGIFAQRAKARPNRIGVTTCELLEVDGHVLTVRGLDAIHGTPVLDLKPYMSGFAPRGEVREPAWARELMASYWTVQ